MRRLTILLAAVSMTAAACSDVPHAEVELPTGNFVPFVADSNDNVGLGNDIAVDAEGVPYVSYFGYEAQLEEGEIATARPVGAPFIPAVQVASVADDGAWTLGAVAQATEFPNVPVPFGPALVESLKSLDPDNANGTSIAVAEDGTRHVTWASNTGIWYAESTDSSSAEPVSRVGTTLNVAGTIGRPGIAVDGSTPWVAWTENVAGRQDVLAATPQGDGWRREVVASIGCADCPAPQPTAIAFTPDGPLIVYGDQASGSVMAARLEGSSWISEIVTDGAAGIGLSLDVDERGDARVSYYTGDGRVEMAVSEGASWSTAEVGESGEIEPAMGNFAPTTGTAVDPDGIAYVAWYDAAADTVKLAREAEAGFEEVETLGTQGGRFPSLDVGPEGSVYLAWYDLSTEDLLVGILGDVGEILVAQPSPTAAIAPPPAPTDCGDDGEIVLETSAASAAAFDVPCLVAPAGEPFELTFDNQDIVGHNLAVYVEEGGEELGATDVAPGPDLQTLPLGPLDPSDYFFNCQIHPTTMTGTLAVVEGGGQ